MIRKFFKYLIKDIKTNYIQYIILVLFVLLMTIHFDYNIYSPGSLIDLTFCGSSSPMNKICWPVGSYTIGDANVFGILNSDSTPSLYIPHITCENTLFCTVLPTFLKQIQWHRKYLKIIL